MGIPELWKLLESASETRYLPEVAVREGFNQNRHGTGFIVVGIDVSIWFYECQAVFRGGGRGRRHLHAQAGQNPELRALFFRLCSLARHPISAVFIFDGPNRPQRKRGRRVRATPHWLTDGFCKLATAFGFYTHRAPGEAEAELAYLNQIQAIDLVLTSDSDIFVFGATHVMRSLHEPKSRLTEQKVQLVTEDTIASKNSPLFSQAGFVFLAAMRGGDYATGLRGCGMQVARALAMGTLATDLLDLVTHKSGHALQKGLALWRTKLRAELRDDPDGRLGRKYPTLAARVDDRFPDMKVVSLYCFPKTSQSLCRPLLHLSDWLSPQMQNTPRLAALCDCYFGWGPAILVRLQRNVWDGQFLWHLIKSRISGVPAGTPLAPNSIRYIVSGLSRGGVLDPDSPTMCPLYWVEIWLSSVTGLAFAAVRDQLPDGHLQGGSTVISLRLWVPVPIMIECAPAEVITHHASNPHLWFYDPRIEYRPLLSDLEICATRVNNQPAATSTVNTATLRNAARSVVTYYEIDSDDDEASSDEEPSGSD